VGNIGCHRFLGKSPLATEHKKHYRTLRPGSANGFGVFNGYNIRKEIGPMTAEELSELISKRPFRPLRLHLADGRVREIRHPEMAIVAETDVVIGVPRDNESKVAIKFTYCSIPNIVEVEPFDLDKGLGGNGEKRPKKGRGR
jgi:hypothetical protein